MDSEGYMMNKEDQPSQTLRQSIMGFRTTQLIYVAARLGIADLLEDGPKSPQSLASAAGVDARALHRVLRALASMGIFAETEAGDFQLTPLARPLLRDSPESVRGLALLYGDEWLWHAYGATLYSVRTGSPAFNDVHGKELFEYLGEHPEAGATFDQAMSSYTGQEAAALVAAYDFSEVATLVDVGGGQGALLTAILKSNQGMRGVLFDVGAVVARAQALLAGEGMEARCDRVAGDFFTSVPSGGDLYLLKSVIHHWDDASSLTILRNCRQAMGDHGRILLAERVIAPGNAPSEAKLLDINMLVVTGGCERTASEYRQLFRDASFELTQIIATRSPISLIEGRPV